MSTRGPVLLGLLLLSACSAEEAAPQMDLGVAPLRGGPLRAPVEDAAAIDPGVIIGIDHSPQVDPNGTQCRNYAGRGFPWCYAGHEGTDFLLLGGFPAMDAGSAWVVAALGGKVIKIEDGHYDRCHAQLGSLQVNCDGHEMKSNYVAIDHGGGLGTEYHHLMMGSMIVHEGDQVQCGQRLARIGSSGRSSLPHLHLNVLRDGKLVDPYAGPYSQKDTLWLEQPTAPAGLPPLRCGP